ncbi:MAG: L-lactate permease [Anaerolineales bacterium]
MITFLMALIPILLILILMLGLRWGAVNASIVGYLTALVIAVFYFGSGVELLAYAHIKALLSSLDVLLIIWAAFLFYRVTDEAKAIAKLGEALPHLTADRGMQALVIGWGFASFLQGVGGFGVPVAVVAPILVGLGFAPMTSIIIPSIGSGWAVTFGSLGSSFQALLATTGLTSTDLAFSAAAFLGISALFTGLMVMHVIEGWRGVLRLAIPALILGAVMGAVQLLVADKGPWNTAAFVGSMAGLLVSFGLARIYRGEQGNNGKLNGKVLALAVSGYAILVIVTLGIQMIPSIKSFFGGVVLKVDVPELTTSLGFINTAKATKPISLLNHAGAVLFYASILAFLLYSFAHSYQPGSIKRILVGTVKRVKAPSISITLMVGMAVIMQMSGMTEALAKGLAQFTGVFFPLIAAWIGALGAFMTGSNTNSNVVFSLLQLRTANLLGYTAAIILAGQTAGAALASVAAPAKVVVGTSTADLAGKEGEVMRKLLPYVVILILLISLLTAVSIWFKL